MNGILATSPPEAGRFGRRWSGEWIFDGGSLGRKNSWAGSDSSLSAESKERLSPATNLATTPPGARIFSRGEWKVYGWHAGCMSSDNKDCRSAATHIATSPPGTPGAGRFSSGEWTVYCGSPGRVSRADSADRVSVSSSQMVSPPSSYVSSGRRLNSAGSGGRLSSASVVRRSSSVGRFTGTGSGGLKPVYSSASGHSVGSAGWGGGERTTNRQRAPSPGRRIGGSGGWLSSSKAPGNRISGAGSGSKVAGSSDRLSSHAGGRISSSGRTNNTGGRVISSSDRPIRSTGSQAGSSKEKISVCKMAALTISAAGRERSQERQRQAQRARQP
ncbi:NACHT, LRR and PYD domains-containing protein 12 [Sarotherodon galilaeus]